MSSTKKDQADDEEALRVLRERKIYEAHGDGSVMGLHELDRRQRGILKKQATKAFAQPQKAEPSKDYEYGAGTHSWHYSMLRHHSHRWHAAHFQYWRGVLISISVINFILQTESFFQKYCTTYFNIFEASLSILFAIEYFVKVGTAPERRVYAHDTRDVARIKWIFSSESLIDFVSWAPFFIEMLWGLNFDQSEVLRMITLFRVFKLPVVWKSLRLVSRVVYYNYEILCSSLFVCFIMLLFCSVLLFYTRPDLNNHAILGSVQYNDPLNDWSSLLACMYIAVLMLTGQGEPDGNMPWYTRVVISITALFAIAQFAIPASMLTWGFEQEAEHNILKQNEREKKAAKRQAQGKNIPDSSSSSDESDRQSEWDGYLEQVLGSEFEGSESSDASEKKGDQEDGKGKPTALTARAQELLAVSASGDDQLTKEERRRAKAIFIKLDADNDDRLDWRKVRAITDTDQQAEDLIGQLRAFQEITGDKSVTMREFFTWLGSVKKNHTRYGDKVLLRLLNHMEYQLFGPGKERKGSRASTIKASTLMKRADTVVAGRARARAASSSQGTQSMPVGAACHTARSEQFLQLAGGFDDLEDENSQLERKIKRLEKELAGMKAAE